MLAKKFQLGPTGPMLAKNFCVRVVSGGFRRFPAVSGWFPGGFRVVSGGFRVVSGWFPAVSGCSEHRPPRACLRRDIFSVRNSRRRQRFFWGHFTHHVILFGPFLGDTFCCAHPAPVFLRFGVSPNRRGVSVKKISIDRVTLRCRSLQVWTYG